MEAMIAQIKGTTISDARWSSTNTSNGNLTTFGKSKV